MLSIGISLWSLLTTLGGSVFGSAFASYAANVATGAWDDNEPMGDTVSSSYPDGGQGAVYSIWDDAESMA